MEAGTVEHVRGHLVLSVQEASGKSQKDLFTWEGIGTGGQFEAFLKVELRGQARSIKAKTQKAPLTGDLIVWKEELKLEVLEGAGELRLMLCREKIQGNKRGTSVIAACGIFLDDILKAVPIDKYFELFKPSGGDGGCLRISMKYIPTTSDSQSLGPTSAAMAEGQSEVSERGGATPEKPEAASKGKSLVRKLLLGAAALGIAAVVGVQAHRRAAKPAKKN